MSDHESETNQTVDGAWDPANAFSSDGSDPADADLVETELDDRTKFLGDLARVMQSTATAEQARIAESTEQRRKAHIDSIREREAEEIEELRELAKEDVKGIDAWSEGEIKRIKLERERRIASRREQLQIRLEEHRSVVGREVDAVEAAIAGYKTDVELFFGRLEAETDPIAIASQAGNQPTFPDLRRIGPDTAPTTPEYSYVAYETRADAQAFADASGDVQDQVEQQEAAVQPAVEAGAAGDAVAAGEAGAVDDGAVAPEGEAEPETLMVGVMDPDGGNPKVGVMDPDAGNRPVETPSISGVDAGQGGVAVAAEATEGSTQGEQAQDQGEGAQEASEELVALAAEARVVMPRSSGAGSWLRWPNSSTDRSDPGR